MNRSTIIKLIMIIICCALTIVRAQTRDFYGHHDSNIYSTFDRHYQGVLFPEAYKNLVSTRVNYPGLWMAETNSAGAGVLPGYFAGSGLRGLYGWADIENGPGTAGLWAGNFNFGSEQRAYHIGYDSTYYRDASEFSLRGAVWITPARDGRFRGLSLTLDIDNTAAYDGNEYMEKLDRKIVYVNLTALVRLTDNYYLRAGIRTYNKQTEDPLDTRYDNCKIYTDGVYLGLVDNELRTLDLVVDNSYGVLYSWEKTDTLTAALRYTEGFANSYQKHLLFVGIKIDLSASFLSDIGEKVGTFEYGTYMRNLRRDGWIMRYATTIPLILDAHIYGTLRGVLSISPRVCYTLIDYERKQNQHTYTMDIPQAEFGLRGVAGKKIDFAFSPTFTEDVFVSALEVRYRF